MLQDDTRLVHEIHDFEQFTGEIGLAEIGEIHCAKQDDRAEVNHQRDDNDPF